MRSLSRSVQLLPLKGRQRTFPQIARLPAHRERGGVLLKIAGEREIHPPAQSSIAATPTSGRSPRDPVAETRPLAVG